MTKVYPSLMTSSARVAEKLKRFSSPPRPPPEPSTSVSENAVALTVWTKSLLFNCTGFTVFDSAGNLVFRVDNYIAGNKGEIVLMDASGKSLFTIRRKRLSLGDNWMIFDDDTAAKPKFTVRKHVNIVNSRCLAHVSSGGSSEYEIEGSYTRRCCAVYDQKRRRVAEIRRKEAAVGGVAIGGDVFRLLIEPEIDSALVMSLVILLDQMYGSSSSRR